MNIVKINDVNDNRLDRYYRHTEKQLHKAYNDKHGYLIAESELIINRCLDAKYKPVSFLIREIDEDRFMYLYKDLDVDVYCVSEEVFKKLKGYLLIRDVLAIFERKPDLTISQVCENSKRIVVLENVENPANVGSIFRNAAALFVDGILLTDDSCDPLYRRSVRVSMGNVFNIKYTYINKENYIDQLHEFGYKTVALALRDDGIDIDDERLLKQEKLAIILGSEGYGMTNSTIEASDYVAKIKMNENVDSLNVASASAIALWQLCSKNR